MFFKIVFVIMLITICSGAPPRYPQTKSNEATYTHKFVREDVPMSYEYSATHYYIPKGVEDSSKRQPEATLKRTENFPQRHESPYEINTLKNVNISPFHPLNKTTIQFAPLPAHPREFTSPPAPVLHTSIYSDPGSEYEQFEPTAALNLEPKRIPTEAKYINPSTYKPHMNHDIKMYHSHHSHLRPKLYRALNTQLVATTAATPKFDMDSMNHLAFFHQLQQQLYQQPKHITSTTTENPKISHVLNLGVTILPKHGLPTRTMPHDLMKNAPFQPIPRIAYHNMFKFVPEKQGRPQTHTRYNQVHLNNSNTHHI